MGTEQQRLVDGHTGKCTLAESAAQGRSGEREFEIRDLVTIYA